MAAKSATEAEKVKAMRSEAESFPSSGTLVATRVADVLTLFLSNPGPLGVSEIAVSLNVSKAVVHRILQSLASRLLVVPTHHGRRYELGPMANALGARALQSSTLLMLAVPVLRAVAKETQETVTISQLVGDRRIYLTQIPSFHEVRMMVELGRPYALHAGGSGRAMLAFCDRELQEGIIHGQLERLTSATITDGRVLREDLEQIRRNGFAISRGERQQGAGSVAAPIFDGLGAVVGALSVCGPGSRLSTALLQRYGPLVRTAAREISNRLEVSASPSSSVPSTTRPGGSAASIRRIA
jgi:IclR family transcriptional regulator, acetate operon repressor